ncbi:MAG TPA: transposase, partial [Methylomirabilota bacterium]
AMAALAQGRLRKKVAELEQALEGRLDEHHRFLLQLQLRRLDHVDLDLASLEARIDDALMPYQAQCAVLQQIPGVSRVVAAVIVAELGTDMSVFRSAQHAAGAPYRDLGATYLDGPEKRHTTQNLVRRLERLGYEVTIGPKVA